MKRFLLLAVFAVIGSWIFAQQPVVAVAPFDAVSGITQADANVLTGVFYTRLGNANVVTLVDRSIVERVIREHYFQLGDWSNPQKTAEFGKALNADWIIRGEIAGLESNIIIINVQFYDINTFQFRGGADISLDNMNEAYEKMTPLVNSLVQTIRASSGGAQSRTYNIGDTGSGGGIVFYDKGIFSGGWRYLEAAPAETEFTAQWGADDRSIAGTGTAVGNGRRNTQLITERLRVLGENDRAAQLCASLNFDGFNDWFLPSKDELDLMYRNLYRRGLGGFSSTWYWSSSQNVNNGVWGQHYGNGNQSSYFKYNTYMVRAVRAF